MMTTTNRYEEIAERQRVRRTRDIAFALLLAAVAVFSLTSIGAAAHHKVSASPTAQTTCAVQTTC